VDSSQIGTNIGGCQRDCESLQSDVVSEKIERGDRNVIRFGKPAKPPAWSDLVYGKMTLDKSKMSLPQRASIADVILLKSDGSPTYHLANVVDDHAMDITHVIRGTEWMPSTALHVALYDAFEWQPPKFAHVGLLTDAEHNKLSKRNFDTDVKSIREENGILAESLVNYLALLGWRNPQRNDIMTLQEIADNVSPYISTGSSSLTLVV